MSINRKAATERPSDGNDHPARGSNRPDGGTIRVPVVVLGATGVIGRGVVRAAVEAACPVIAIARDPAELERLREEHPAADLLTLEGSVADDAHADRLVQSLRQIDRAVAGVIVAIAGKTARGRLLDQPTAALEQTLATDLLPQLTAARHLLPLLAEPRHGGNYVIVSGPAGDRPWAGYGHYSIAAAALRMFASVLHDEARAIAVRAQLLAVDMPARSECNAAHACDRWPSDLSIGRRALQLLARADADAPARAIVKFSQEQSTP